MNESLSNGTVTSRTQTTLQYMERKLQDIIRRRKCSRNLIILTQRLFELRNMDHWMDTAALRKLQLISNLPHTRQH
jgi:hypothetical protein